MKTPCRMAGVDRINAVCACGEAGRSCSEAILEAYADSFGLDRELAVKISSGFGGGIGLRGDVCGAVTAGAMVLGLAFGATDPAEGYRRQKTYMVVDDFTDQFIGRLGALECRSLCAGHSMATPEGAKALRQSGRPLAIIRAAAEILEDILAEYSE